jgi:Domain of unknown function (DUF4157)
LIRVEDDIMGMLILNSALTTAMATLRTGGLPATLPITFASASSSHPGMTYVQDGAQLVALLRKHGMPAGREIRVQWAASPSAPVSAVNDVRQALASAGFGGVPGAGGQNPLADMGARAFTAGNDISFGSGPDQNALPHEATHVIQQRR